MSTHLGIIVVISCLVALHVSSASVFAPLVLPVIHWTVEAVGEIVGGVSLVVKVHGAVPLVVLDSAPCPVRAVDRKLGVVGPQAMYVGVMVGEQTTLEEKVERELAGCQDIKTASILEITIILFPIFPSSRF